MTRAQCPIRDCKADATEIATIQSEKEEDLYTVVRFCAEHRYAIRRLKWADEEARD